MKKILVLIYVLSFLSFTQSQDANATIINSKTNWVDTTGTIMTEGRATNAINIINANMSSNSTATGLRKLNSDSSGVNGYASYARAQKLIDSLKAYIVATYATITNLSLKLALADTANMLSVYARKVRTINNAPGRSIVSVAAAANGWLVSSANESEVTYSVTISCAVQIGVVTNVEGYVVLEVAATNSVTASDWKEIDRVTNGQNISLALALATTAKVGSGISGIVPNGWYVRIRSVNTSGTPTYVYNSGQETY